MLQQRSLHKADSKQRIVPESEGKKWAGARGLPYFETSAKEGENVGPMFEALFAAVVAKK